MSTNKSCGNCAHSYGKDMDGYCACGIDDHFTGCDEVCDKHIMSINGWTEITPNNEHVFTNELMARIIIGHIDNLGRMSTMTWLNCYLGIGTMAKCGGYYYYVLPELNIE